MNREGSITRTLIFMLLGPIAWALHFLVVYGSHASYCAVGERLPGQPDTVIPVLQWSATIAAALVLAEMEGEADEVVCLETATGLGAIGYFYEDFSQVTDAEVIAALAAAPQAKPES